MTSLAERRDLTRGPIVAKVASFAAPLLLASLVQQLYSTVDLLFCGNVLGTDATAAIGISALLITCLVSLMNGLSAGVGVVVAQLFGAGDERGVACAMRTALLFGILAGSALSVAGYLFAPTFVRLMGTPPTVVADARAYLQIYLVAMVAVMLYNLAAALCRALGDSLTPLLAQLAGGILNVGANGLALCVLNMGVAGVAWATLISNGVAAALTLATLGRGQEGVPPLRLRGRTSAGLLRRMLAVGAPVGAQMAAISLSNVFLQSKIDLLGVDAIAAFAIYLRVELPIYYGIVALGQATTTFVAQNHGARDHARSARGAALCQLLALGYAAVSSALLLALGYWAFWIFDQSEAVISCGLQIISVTFPFYIAYAVLEVQGDAARGYGNSLVPALIVLANICVLRTGLLYILCADGASLFAVAVTYPITWVSTAACMVAYRIVLERRYGHWAFPSLGQRDGRFRCEKE